jgi:2-succinyl-5-enolpyruvyl-6-hydroxy-3-cyclohexene-1-carboxylate synthase
MPIRDADAFAWSRDGALSVYANRGASGIDGLVSSAAGAAAATARPTLLVAGDLAVLHDLNGFHAVRRHGIPLVTLVVNNDGGGIFSFLPVSEFADVFEPFFATPHGLGFQPVAALFGLAYTRADSPAGAAKAVASAFSAGGAHLIEIASQRSRNAEEHRGLAAKVAAAVDREVRWKP